MVAGSQLNRMEAPYADVFKNTDPVSTNWGAMSDQPGYFAVEVHILEVKRLSSHLGS